MKIHTNEKIEKFKKCLETEMRIIGNAGSKNYDIKNAEDFLNVAIRHIKQFFYSNIPRTVSKETFESSSESHSQAYLVEMIEKMKIRLEYSLLVSGIIKSTAAMLPPENNSFEELVNKRLKALAEEIEKYLIFE